MTILSCEFRGSKETNLCSAEDTTRQDVQVLLPLDPVRILHGRFGTPALPFNAQLDYESSFNVRRWIVAHAHRSVFSYREEPHVGGRVVDPEQFEQERQFWSEWHTSQSAAERELLNGAELF